MADLEERFLQKNVPGRYSSWEDYDGGGGGGGRVSREDEGLDNGCNDIVDSELDGCDNGGVGGGLSTSRQRSAAAPTVSPTPFSGGGSVGRLPRGGNTGVRSVAADYRAAKEEAAYRAALERRENQEAWDRAVNGGRLRPGEGSLSLAEARRVESRISRGDPDEPGSEEDGNDEDSDFLEEYRARRLQQLQSEASASSLHTYGSLTEVTKFEFADAVDSTDPRTTLAVHMYDPSVRSCAVLNQILRDLAPAMSHVRFLRLRSDEAGLNVDPVGMPSLALYRGGELVHNLTPVTERLPAEYDMEDVRELLEECGAHCPRPTQGEMVLQRRRGGSGGNYNGAVTGGQAPTMMLARPVVPADDYDSEDAELDELCKDFEPSC